MWLTARVEDWGVREGTRELPLNTFYLHPFYFPLEESHSHLPLFFVLLRRIVTLWPTTLQVLPSEFESSRLDVRQLRKSNKTLNSFYLLSLLLKNPNSF